MSKLRFILQVPEPYSNLDLVSFLYTTPKCPALLPPFTYNHNPEVDTDLPISWCYLHCVTLPWHLLGNENQSTQKRKATNETKVSYWIKLFSLFFFFNIIHSNWFMCIDPTGPLWVLNSAQNLNRKEAHGKPFTRAPLHMSLFLKRMGVAALNSKDLEMTSSCWHQMTLGTFWWAELPSNSLPALVWHLIQSLSGPGCKLYGCYQAKPIPSWLSEFLGLAWLADPGVFALNPLEVNHLSTLMSSICKACSSNCFSNQTVTFLILFD